MRIKHNLLLSLLLILLPFSVFGASVKLTTDAVNGKVEVGESFHIIIEAINSPGNMELNELPPGVKTVYQSTQSMRGQTIVNGATETHQSTKLVLTCKGEVPGKYTYGPIMIGGTRSNTVSYQVVAAGTGTGNATQQGNTTQTNSNAFDPRTYNPNSGPVFVGGGNEEMFLRATVNKTSAYEQEAIEYQVKLYSSYEYIKFMGATAAPKFDGFVIEESKDVSNSLTRETYNGKTYLTAIIARYIIFPQKSGSLKIQGNTYTVSTDARKYYHDPYFQTMTAVYPVQLNVTPNDVNINVKPLPTPIPNNFIGGVGQFRLTSSMPDRNLSTNAPASLIYKIEGSGNIKYLTMPDLATMFPSSIEVYSPENTVNVNVGSSNVSGTSQFDFSIVPKEAGKFTIPSVDLYYFDPSDGQYKLLRTESFNIDVSRGQASSKSQQALSFNADLMPVGKTMIGEHVPYVYTWWYWLWYGIPVIIFIVALSSYRKYLREHEDLTLLRSKKASKMALKRLAKAYKCYQNHQEEQFYDEMLAALWGYIGDKLKMPTSDLNRNNVGDEFKKHGVKESTFMPIINLIDECEYAKYTPVERDANMRQLYTDALESLEKVESEYEEETGQKDSDEDDDETGGSVQDSYINTSAETNTQQIKPQPSPDETDNAKANDNNTETPKSTGDE